MNTAPVQPLLCVNDLRTWFEVRGVGLFGSEKVRSRSGRRRFYHS